MEKVKVEKISLLSKLRENRDKHKDEFDEAMTGWKGQMAQAYQDAAERFSQEDYSDLNPYATRPKPQHHLKDYDLAIRMLEMSVDDNIEIEQHDFNQYVMDEWSWKAGFALTNSSYLS